MTSALYTVRSFSLSQVLVHPTEDHVSCIVMKRIKPPYIRVLTEETLARQCDLNPVVPVVTSPAVEPSAAAAVDTPVLRVVHTTRGVPRIISRKSVNLTLPIFPTELSSSPATLPYKPPLGLQVSASDPLPLLPISDPQQESQLELLTQTQQVPPSPSPSPPDLPHNLVSYVPTQLKIYLFVLHIVLVYLLFAWKSR
jgi:hypothetical protein